MRSLEAGGKIFCTQSGYFIISNGVSKVNFLAVVTLSNAQVLAYAYITVKFQLRSSINVRLTESSLYNRFCIERSPKKGFWGNFGVGLRYLVGTP